MMNRLFGKSGAQPNAQAPVQVKGPTQEPPKRYDLSEQSKRTEAKVKELTQSINDLDKEIAFNYAKTKQLRGIQANTSKQRCLALLKKKRMQEQQLQNMLNNQITLDQVTFTKENISNTQEMSVAMQQAMAEQKDMMKDTNIDKLEDMMENMQDMKYDSEQINEMMNRNYGVNIDEDELDREMQEIDNEMNANQYNVSQKVASKYQYPSEQKDIQMQQQH